MLTKQFFKLYATVRKDYEQAYKWCTKDLRDNPPADWESAVLGLFKETYPLYPQEPLLLLIKSGVFIKYYNNEYNSKTCYEKLRLFVLLASKADCKEIFECLYKRDSLKKNISITIYEMF